MAGYLIEVENLITKYGEKVVHDGLNMKIERNQIYALIGESGAGKSTLLRELLLLKDIDGGTIKFEGKDLTKLSEKEKQKIREKMAVLFQSAAMFSSLTVGENIVYAIKKKYKIDDKLSKEMAILKLQLAGLKPEVYWLYPYQLSGGMRKKAGLARALATDPKIIFLDEPISGLDPISSDDFDITIKNLVKSLDITVFMITHDVASLFFADKIGVLADKKIIYEGNLEGLKYVDNRWVKEFINSFRVRRLIIGK